MTFRLFFQLVLLCSPFAASASIDEAINDPARLSEARERVPELSP